MARLVHDYRLPQLAVKTVDTLLTLVVRDEAGTAQTPSAGVVTVKLGDSTIVDAASITLGAESSYTLTAAVLAAEVYTLRGIVSWTVTIDGATETFEQPLYLVRKTARSTVTEARLLALHPELDRLKAPGQTDWSTAILEGWIRFNEKLIAKGRRAHLIFDEWATANAQTYITLEIIFRGMKSSLNDERFTELQAEYRQLAREAFEEISFTYDEDEDGVVDTTATVSGQPVTYLNLNIGGVY